MLDLWQAHYLILLIISRKCKDKKNCKCKDCDCFLEYDNINDNLTNYKCLSCNKNR